MNNQDSLAKASKQLMLKHPFYGLFLMMLNKRFDKTFSTAGVTKNGINYSLIIGNDFWESLKEQWQIGIIHHECLHIAFFHLETHDRYPDKDLANIAHDMEINQYIDGECLPGFELSRKDFDAMYNPIMDKLVQDLIAGTMSTEVYNKEIRKIPPRGVYIKDFSELKLDLKAGSKYYYDKLKEAKDKKQQSAGRGEDSKASGSESGNGKGTSGSSALDGLLEQMEAGKEVVCSHGTWKEFEGLSETEKKMLHSQTDFHLKEIADQIIKSRGTIPSELKEYIDQIDYKEPPKFDWKRYLRRFAGGSTKTYTKKLHRKYNKRFEGLPGLKIKQRRHILVSIDTSGSVSKDELKEFFHEIHHIHKGGTEVTVLQCDAAISNIAPYKKGCEDKISVFGRGGTDFNPPLRYFDENLHKFTAMLYFTDGECSRPEKSKGKVLWILSSKSKENLDLPGQIIKLN